MATRSSSYSPTAAPWRATFLEHVSKLDDPYMAVSTVGRDPKTGAPVPRVRYCGYRCLFGDLDLHPSAAKQLEEEKETNPPVYETDMLTFTTDVRMEKTENFKDFDGAIEVAFWVKDVMTQWRIRGKAFVVGDDPKKQSEKEARSEISKGLRKKADQQASVDEKDWTWEKEIASYFANHSPVMRGTLSVGVHLIDM
jgi:pyridoxamine 5'-phosphate oxidase